MQELITSLKNTERKVSPTCHAMVLLMPTQKQIKTIVETQPTIDAPRMAGVIKSRSEAFKDFYLGGVQTASGMTLLEALDLYEDFHILEALPQRWSAHHLFKCNRHLKLRKLCKHYAEITSNDYAFYAIYAIYAFFAIFANYANYANYTNYAI